MLIIGETFNQRKDQMWSFIHTCQDLIKAIQGSSVARSSLAREVIKAEREIINKEYAELKELQRWFKTSGLEPDEPYQSPSHKAWLASLSDEEMEIEVEKAYQRDMQILALKERLGME